MDKGEFQETVIEQLHNEKTVIVAMSFVGLFDADEEHSSINPKKLLTQNRSGAWLKDKLFAIRASFNREFNK